MEDVIEIFVDVMKLSIELFQNRIEPLYPVNVNIPAFAPAHCGTIGPETLPGIEIPVIEIVIGLEIAGPHTLFCTVALKLVVVVKLENE